MQKAFGLETRMSTTMVPPSSAKQSFELWSAHFIGWVQKGIFLLILMQYAIISSASSSSAAQMTLDQRARQIITKAATTNDNNKRQRGRRRLRSGTECTLYMRETHYEGHPHSHSKSDSPVYEDKEKTWMCEVPLEWSEEDTADPSAQLGNTNNFNEEILHLRYPSRENNGSGSTPTMPMTTANIPAASPMILVEIKGLSEDFFDIHGIKSGLTKLRISEGYLEGDEGDDDHEAKNENSKGNIFARMSDEGDTVTTFSIDSRKDRNRPTILTKMIVSPESVTDLVDLSLGDIEADGDEEIEIEVHSGNIFQRNSLGITRSQQQHKKQRKRFKAIGELTTLVVRIIAPTGAEPINNITETQKMAFYDSVCLKSQYAACSNNQTVIKPFEGTTSTEVKIEKGVVDILVDINPTGPNHQNPNRKSNKDEFVIRAERMTEEKLGPLAEQFDLVLFCIPPGTGDHWTAFANVNRYDSYYNNEWCGHVSAQLHEVGHSLNLAHSGEGETRNEESKYEDKSGMMGSSFPNDDAPKMCFNGAKNYQLNWYTNQQLSIDPTRGKPEIMTETSKTRTFVMNGIVDYKSEGDSQGKLVSLRLHQLGTQHDYYIGYNRASGFNEGTQENINEVIVWEKPAGGPYDYGQSWKLTSLRYEGQLYVIPDFGPRKKFVEIKLLTNPVEGSYRNGKQDVSISITSYKGVGYCKYPEELRVPFEVKGRTDDYGYETSWNIKEDSSTVGYVDFGSGYDRNTAFESTKNLCPGTCYIFEFHDLYGDGLCDEKQCGNRGGFFEGRLNGDEIFSGSSFQAKGVMKRFCVPDIDPSAHSVSCEDSTTLQYSNYSDKDCSWVRKRKKKRCGRVWEDKPLSEWCPSSCKFCS